MVVKKKSKTMDKSTDGQLELDLTNELKTVRDEIINLTEEDLDMSNEETEEGKTKKKKKAKAEAAEETPKAKKKAKKAEKEESGEKEPKASGSEVTLKEICDEHGVETRVARKALRAANIEQPEGGRWAWGKKSPDLKEVRNVVKGIAKAA